MARQLSGFRLIDGDAVNDLSDLKNLTAGGGLTALAGGGRPGATQLQAGLNRVATVASASDSVLLPVASKGQVVFVANAGANNMTVFAQGSDFINATAGATGLAQNAGVSALYFCAQDTFWSRILSA